MIIGGKYPMESRIQGVKDKNTIIGHAGIIDNQRIKRVWNMLNNGFDQNNKFVKCLSGR